MVENSETIEARLCAYVDGELDAHERAELEKHLDTHPQHRRLLAELASQRDLLRRLPREPAPGDMAEAIQERLERNALLETAAAPAPRAADAARIWPRLLATAAVVALIAGIGWMAYVALPRNPANVGKPQFSLADRPAGTTTTVPASQAIGSEALAKRETAPPAAPMPMESAPGASGGSTDHEAAAAAEPPPSEPVTLVVKARDLPAAHTQVESFLAQNSLAWRSAAEGPASENALNAVSDAVANQSTAAAGGYGGRTGGGGYGGYGGYGGQGGYGGGAMPRPSLSQSATAPAGGPLAAAQPPAAARARQMEPESNSTTQYAYNDSRVSAYQTRMTRRQAALLRSELSNRTGQQADLRSDATLNLLHDRAASKATVPAFDEAATLPAPPQSAGGVTPPTTRDATTRSAASAAAGQSTVQLNETLKITIDELAGPDQDKTTQATVGPDGTITLPKLDESVTAVGRTPTELAEEIARHYRDAKVIDAPTVSVEHGNVATTAAEGLVDVTIIVQPDQPPATLPTTAPATRPASAPATAPVR